MATLPTISGKRLMIDKANANMLIVIGITSFIVTFSLIACKALLSQSGYQTRVIKAKNTALKQLKENSKSVSSLVSSYKTFAESPVNIIDGNPTGTGPRDGDNPTIILDALPSKYDFPGLISSVEKMLKDGGYKIDSIGGTDDEIAQLNSATNDPQPVEIPLPIGVSTDYAGAQSILTTLENSIRPIYVEQISVVANGHSELKLSIATNTYYQPEKTLKIGSKEIK